MSEDGPEKRSHRYLKTAVGSALAAAGGISVQQSVLGYFALKGELPSMDSMQKTFHKMGDSGAEHSVFHVFGRPGVIAAVAGIAAGAVACVVFNRFGLAEQAKARHQENRQAR